MSDDYVHALVECVNDQDIGVTLTADDVRRASRRQDLGISSLSVILVVAAYLGSKPDAGATLEPDWVPRLDDVAGILSVFEEIDRRSTRAGTVT